MSVISKMTVSINNSGYTRTYLSLTIIFATVIFAYSASLGMESPTENLLLNIYTAYKSFLIGSFGAGVWLFCVVMWADGEHFIRNKMIPPWSVATFYILIGGVITRIFSSTPNAEIAIFFKGFSWPGIFISILSIARLSRSTEQMSRMYRSVAQILSYLSDEPTDIGETEI